MIIVAWRRDKTAQYVLTRGRDMGFAPAALWLDDALSADSDIPVNADTMLFLRWIVPGSLLTTHATLASLLARIIELPTHRVFGHPRANLSNFSKFVHDIEFCDSCAKYDVRLPTTTLSNALVPAHLKSRPLVTKGISSAKSICVEIGEEHLRALEAGTHHGLVQEMIIGPDVRVHVVNNRCFAEMAVSREVDYRFAKRKRFATVELPPTIHRFCLDIASRIDTPFCGIDFKLDWKGTWYFLEVNASPAFQGYDRRASGEILSAILSHAECVG